jgi:hypothetical protein
MAPLCRRTTGQVLSAVVCVALIVFMVLYFSNEFSKCSGDYIGYSLKRALFFGTFGYNFDVEINSTIVVSFIRSGVGDVTIIAPLFNGSMAKTSMGAFIIPSYNIVLNGTTGEIGMNIAGFIDRYTAHVGSYTLTVKDTWLPSTIPDKYNIIDTQGSTRMRLTKKVTVIPQWNLCINPETNMFEKTVLFCIAATVGIHE